MFGSKSTRSPPFEVRPPKQPRSHYQQSTRDTPAYHRLSFTPPPSSSFISRLPPARDPTPSGSLRNSSPAAESSLSQPLRVKHSQSTPTPTFSTDSNDNDNDTSGEAYKPTLPGTISPPSIGVNDAFDRITKWISSDRPGPFLTIHCTPEVFASTAKRLEAQGHLPQITRDYDPRTMAWHIRGRPHFLHELGNIVLRRIEDLAHPKLSEGKFAPLARKLVWNSGSNTSRLPSLGSKEPDASLGMVNRALPTIVIEVGYSESRAKLRLDAARWLQTGQLDDTERKRKREDEGGSVTTLKPRPVMLVILISFEGQRPSEDVGIDYSEQDYELTGDPHAPGPKPLSIFVELWRLRAGSDSRPATRSNSPDSPDLALYPDMCERKRFFPEDTESEDWITLFATDFFGTDKVKDSRNASKFKIPLSFFREAYAVKLSMYQAEKMDAEGNIVDDDDSLIVVTSDEEGGNEGPNEVEHQEVGELCLDDLVKGSIIGTRNASERSHQVVGENEHDTEPPGETKRLRV